MQIATRRLPTVLLAVVLIGGCTSTPNTNPEHVPAGFQLVYESSFDTPDAVDAFVFTDPDAWRYAKTEDNNGYLELHQQSAYEPTHRSPLNIALIKVGRVESFVLEVDLMQHGREYGHRDMCVFFGFNDPEHFYYTHMATKADNNAHQIMVVNGAPRTPITAERTAGADWGNNAWRYIRVVRDASTGQIAVYFNDMDKPAQVATDKTFQSGYVGFGSFDDVGRVDNIRLWAESIGDQPCKHLMPKPE